jgi:hypothetical protein
MMAEGKTAGMECRGMSDRALKMLRIYLDARAAEEAEAGIDADRIDGEVSASARRMVGEIIERHPDKAISIIRNWMVQYH